MHRNHQRRRNVTLWVVQGLLAALFLFAGGMKLITPTEVLSLTSPFPGEFIKFIGACEVLGVLALVDVVIGVLAATVVYGRREALSVLCPTALRLQPAAA